MGLFHEKAKRRECFSCHRHNYLIFSTLIDRIGVGLIGERRLKS